MLFIIFLAEDITNYLAYFGQPFTFSHGPILILFSVIFFGNEGKNGMYKCFSVNCLFENLSLNLPFPTRFFYFLKKEINLTPFSLTHTRLSQTPID